MMKKISLMFFLCILFILPTDAQKSVQLYPRTSFVGITQKSNTYTKQSIEKDPKHFYVGYNTSTQTYARGYLEFDLSKIPTDAKITSAALRLSGNAGSYPNFGGKIRIERAALGLAYATEAEWGMLKLIGSGNDGIGIQATFTDNPADIQYIGGNYLTGCLNDSKGKKVAFMIVHLESNKLIYLSGTNETLYLDITYTEATPTPTPPIVTPPFPPAGNTGGNSTFIKDGDSYPLPSQILSGDILTLGFKNWNLNFAKVEYDINLLSEISRGNGCVKFRVKDIIGSQRTTVIIALEQKFVFGKDTKTHTYSFPVNGVPIMNYNSYERTVCSGGIVEYRIDNFIGYQSDITWQAGTNMTFVSASGEYATYRASGKGYGTVKAVVINKGKTYNLESSMVWVGEPIASRPPYTTDEAIVLPSNTNMVEVSSYIQGAQNHNWTFTKGRDKCIRVDGLQDADRNGFWPAKPTGSDIYNEYIFDVQGVNSCGTVTNRIRFIYPKYTNGVFDLRSASIENTDQPEIKSVKIYNLSGVIVYSNDAVDGSFDIKSTPLTDGVYIIEKFDGENRTSEKVMLKR